MCVACAIGIGKGRKYNRRHNDVVHRRPTAAAKVLGNSIMTRSGQDLIVLIPLLMQAANHTRHVYASQCMHAKFWAAPPRGAQPTKLSLRHSSSPPPYGSKCTYASCFVDIDLMYT